MSATEILLFLCLHIFQFHVSFLHSPADVLFVVGLSLPPVKRTPFAASTPFDRSL